MPFKKDKAIGVIVFYKSGRSLKFLILKHKKGHWSFAKGHAEKGESELHTARRELREEAGLKKVKFISKEILLKEKYVFKNKTGIEVRKSVEYFIAGTDDAKIKIDNDEIADYKWCTLSQSDKLLTYRQSYKTLDEAGKIVKKYLSKK